MRRTMLVKVSGDLCENESVISWIASIARDYFVVILVGGGTQINKIFEEKGFPVGKHGPLGRETKTFEERQVARDVLESNQAKTQDILAERGIPAVVVIPVLEIGSVLCHVNGDVFVLAAYHGYDAIFVVTTPERIEKKRAYFVAYPKIQVVAF